MKKILVVLALVVLATTLKAQSEPGTFYVQPKVGMNVANFMGPGNSNPRFGFIGGVEMELFATQTWSFSFGALYSMQGAVSPDYQFLGEKLKMAAETDYIKIPVLMNFYVIKGLAFKMGVQLAINVTSDYAIKSQGNKLKGRLSDFGMNVRNGDLDFSIPIGLSYEFYNVVLDARYNFSTTRFSEDDASRHSVFQFTVGYKFRVR